MQDLNLNNHSVGNDIPPVIFGTSGLGNLYEQVSFETKLCIIKECITHSFPLTIFDSAGKYGAGLSLEVLGRALSELNVDSSKVIISNNWFR